MAHCCVQILKPSKSWLNLSNLCTTSLRLMKPTRETCFTAYRDQNPRTQPPMTATRATTRGQWLLELSQAPPQILDSQPRSQSHALPRRPCRPPIYLTWESGGHTTLHAPPGFMAAPPCADTATDVIWRHMMTSSLHVSSHASTSTSAALLLDPWPDPETQNRPGPVSIDFNPGPVDFDFCVDLWPKVKISDNAYLAQFFA